MATKLVNYMKVKGYYIFIYILNLKRHQINVKIILSGVLSVLSASWRFRILRILSSSFMKTGAIIISN